MSEVRPVDANALKGEFDDISAKSASGQMQLIPVKDIKQIIDKAPTIERPRGKWVWVGALWMENFRFKCENCGKIVDDRENYCPKCGLKME